MLSVQVKRLQLSHTGQSRHESVPPWTKQEEQSSPALSSAAPSLADMQVSLLWGGGGVGWWGVENEPVKCAGTPLH